MCNRDYVIREGSTYVLSTIYHSKLLTGILLIKVVCYPLCCIARLCFTVVLQFSAFVFKKFHLTKLFILSVLSTKSIFNSQYLHLNSIMTTGRKININFNKYLLILCSRTKLVSSEQKKRKLPFEQRSNRVLFHLLQFLRSWR